MSDHPLISLPDITQKHLGKISQMEGVRLPSREENKLYDGEDRNNLKQICEEKANKSKKTEPRQKSGFAYRCAVARSY